MHHLRAGEIYWCSTPLEIKGHQPGPHYCVILEDHDPEASPEEVDVCFITSQDRPATDSNERVALPYSPIDGPHRCSSGLTKRSFAIPEWSGVVHPSTLANKRLGYLSGKALLKVQAAVEAFLFGPVDDEDQEG